MANTKEDVASQALARLGEPAISNFTDDDDTAEKVNQLYETEILALISSYDWNFARTRVALVEDAAANPVTKWERGFLMPTLQTDRVGQPLAVYNSTSLQSLPVFQYEISTTWILTNEDVCIVEYTKREPENVWPGYFTKLAVEALAAMLALPITENRAKEEHHQKKAFGVPSDNGRGGLYGAAVAADEAGDPTKSLLDDTDPMFSARFGSI